MSSPSKQNIVIVGGGFAGLNAWKALSARLDATQHNLVLVTSRPYFTYYPGTARMVTTAEGKLEDVVLMPLSEARYNTGNKKLIIASVTSVVEQGSVGGYLDLDNGDKVDYSVLVLASGTTYEGPFSIPDTKSGAVAFITSWRERFAKANDIVLVGGGAVGLELAGEIKDLSPSKNVTIVHGQALLLNESYPESWRASVAKSFGSRGIDFILGDYVDDLEIKEGYVTTRSGKRIKADLAVTTRGGRPSTKFVASLGDDVLSASGTVKITPTLQVVGHPRIFAAGDIIEWKEQRQAGAKSPAHALVIAHNTLVLLGATKKAAIQYKGTKELILLVNGKNGGAGYFPILWGVTIGNWLASLIKSRSLLVGYTKKTFGFD
ncbi:hypothetical protein HYPSUDRAFT_1066992 [Hypholoma sublateritium FD-334 SS-4]|uniref:FAD/NAD(P)-binding domain-containing protein n=1 Tax=Hypholoma sublateritium (strain FD-334 SS-4) TaxID=945553 RepID=A0A0D2LY59_HYPSF|nr:hypothetical protein HYPSUDRAFT_1066992 [Hypholoma sublateritium FD-334 SS-4]